LPSWRNALEKDATPGQQRRTRRVHDTEGMARAVLASGSAMEADPGALAMPAYAAVSALAALAAGDQQGT